jgi:AcrR family transcriptional regulator
MPPTRRGERTRSRIIRQCAAVIDRLGFHGATLNEMVDATGLTRGAFYFHFDSKDALAAAIVQEQAELWPRLLKAVVTARPDPLGRLMHFAFASAALHQSEVVVRAGSRLIAERQLVALELRETYPFWVDSVHALLVEAEACGQLRNAGDLVRPGTAEHRKDPAGLYALAELLVGSWIGAQAAPGGEQPDPAGRVYAGWRIVIAALCAVPEPRDSLVALGGELADELRADPESMVAGLLGD